MSNHLVKCRRFIHSKQFHVKKKLTLARTCSIPFSMFPYIYVMLFLNFEFADETLQTDVWTELELLRKDLNLVRFRVKDSCRLKTPLHKLS